MSTKSQAHVSADAWYRLVRCIKLYRREQLGNVGKLLARNHDDPVGLFKGIVDNYGPEPAPEQLATRVRRFFEVHDTASVATAGDIAKAYSGRDGECMAMLCEKYKVPEEPMPPTPRGGEVAVVGGAAPASAPVAPPAQEFHGGPYPDAAAPRSEQKVALIAFYRKYGVDRTEAEIESNLDRYEGKFGDMWAILDGKYATPAARTVDAPPTEMTLQKEKLARFYNDRGITKSQDEIDASIEKYAKAENGGYTQMWEVLQNRYPANGTQNPSAAEGTHAPGSSPQSALAENPYVTTSDGPPTQLDPETDRSFNRERLKQYYASKNMPKTDEDIENSLARYSSPESGGFAVMWQILERKYGPEDPDATQRLMAFFSNRGIAKSDEEISHILTLHRANGLDRMWVMLEAKYPANGPAANVVDSASAATKALERNDNKTRLVRYYKHYNVIRTAEEIEVALDMASEKVNGFEKMWKLLIAKYGPEPPPTPRLAPTAVIAPSAASAPAKDNPTDPVVFERLRNFYKRYDANKTENDIRVIMKRYAEGAGFTEMFRILESKYGPEPKAAGTKGAEPMSVKDRLVRFYKHYNVTKTTAEIDTVLAKYASAPGGYDNMFAGLERKYGPEPALTGDLDTIRLLDPRTTTPATFFITPRGLLRSIETLKEKEPGVIFAPTHEAPFSKTALQGVADATLRQHDVTESTYRDVQGSLVHLELLISGADYEYYERADEARRAAFRQGVADQVAANAGIPTKLLTVTRVAHDVLFRVELDYDVPLGEEGQAAAVAELLARKVDASVFHTGIMKEAYRRHLGGNPVQLVVQSFTCEHHMGDGGFERNPAAALMSMNDEEFMMMEDAFSAPPRGHHSRAALGRVSPQRDMPQYPPPQQSGFNDPTGYLLGEARRGDARANAPRGFDVQQHRDSREARAYAQPRGAAHEDRSVQRDRFRETIRTQRGAREGSPNMHSFLSGPEDASVRQGQDDGGNGFLEGLWAQQTGVVRNRGGSPQQQRRGGGRPGVIDRTPAALEGLGLTTTNPIAAGSPFGPADLGSLSPGALELARMQGGFESNRRKAVATHRAAYGLDSGPNGGPPHTAWQQDTASVDVGSFAQSQRGPRGTAPDWRAQSLHGAKSISSANVRSSQPWSAAASEVFGRNDDVTMGGGWAATAFTPPTSDGFAGRYSASPAPMRPGRSLGGQQSPYSYSSRSSNHDANYMYGVVDALNRR